MLQQNEVFDAELSMAGIFEVKSAARAPLLEALTLGKLLLLPALLTDDGHGHGIPDFGLWRSFLDSCSCFWLDASRCFSRAGTEFFGHGDAVHLSVDLSCEELCAACDFPSRRSRAAFEAPLALPEVSKVAITLWISPLDLSAHIHLPDCSSTERDQRLNCMILGSDMKKVHFFGGTPGGIEVNAEGGHLQTDMVKDLGAGSWVT